MQIVKSLKAELESYYSKYEKKQQEVDKALRLYQPDVAQEQIEKISLQFSGEKESTIAAIRKIEAAATESIKNWAVLSGAKIDEADVKLLEYDLNSEQFETLVEKHKDNGTMCFVLGEYARKHNATIDVMNPEEYTRGWLHESIVPTEKNKLQALKHFVQSAMSTIDALDYEGPYHMAKTPDVLQHTVKEFGEPSALNYEFLSVLEG